MVGVRYREIRVGKGPDGKIQCTERRYGTDSPIQNYLESPASQQYYRKKPTRNNKKSKCYV